MDFILSSNFNEAKNFWEVFITGEIDIYNSVKFKESLSSLIDSKPKDIYIYCEKLEYIDSTGLGALVAILKKVRQYNGNIHLFNLTPSVSKLFKITDLNKVFILEGDANE
jgi:anti-sigma B factor antagonist